MFGIYIKYLENVDVKLEGKAMRKDETLVIATNMNTRVIVMTKSVLNMYSSIV
ncbi:MAG: hypothetical protein PHG66_04450 [Candidatus Colwellbacteria bacterium]|nr:hypothetical protein [Candidatus Colwellbacteria bacterium]